MARQNSANNILLGTTAGGNATAGYVGEFISSQVTLASAISISNNVLKNLTSISLTAGDWDVFGNIAFVPASGTTATNYTVGISTTSATMPDGSLQTQFTINFPATLPQGINASAQRINVSSTTTVYIVALANFTVSTMTMCGGIYARRAR